MSHHKVVFLSDLQANHYRSLLIENLQIKGCTVEDYLPSLFFVHKVFWKFKPEILHLHALQTILDSRCELGRWIKFLIFTSQIFLLKVLGVKVVWTVHEWKDRLSGGRNNIHQFWISIFRSLFSAIITHCTTTQNEVAEKFKLLKGDKVFVVPHGNYIGSYRNSCDQASARKILGIGTENFTFLLFGNIHRTKGFLEAIDAFNELNRSDTSLLIAGNPAEIDVVEAIKDKIHGRQNIVFVPKIIPDQDIQIYMNACDCVVVPYKVFTTSGVTILSMSFSKPCIAPRLGFFSDVLDDSGAFLFDPNLEHGLLCAMKDAIDHRVRIRDMGQHNFNLVSKANWDDIAQETVKVYEIAQKELKIAF